MKSLCIKTNNSSTIDYLLDELEHMNIENVYFVCKKFKFYNNIIIHYTGSDEELFLNEISTLLSYLVIDNFEESFLKKIIMHDYFYFDKYEVQKVIDICLEILYENDEFSFDNRYLILFDNFYDYITSNKKLFLIGFIYFRLKDYLEFLETIVNTAVNKFIIEREYVEFISLLKLYINSNSNNSKIVHLIYKDSEIALLDENSNLIDITSFDFDSRYMSDISFSSNDYILNALLSILPCKIIIHLGNNKIDDFINTLILIFENRITFCIEKNESRFSNKQSQNKL